MINKKFFDPNYYNEVVFESENFVVIPSLGSLIEGWLLIIPKKHYLSFGLINDSLLYAEYKLLEDKVCKIVTEEFGKPILFEHGPVYEQSVVGCGVDYAHMHVVPYEIDLIKECQKDFNFDWIEIANVEKTTIYALKNKPYLYFSNRTENFLSTSEIIPSQLFRKIFAKKTGMDLLWDWKKNAFEDNVLKTLERLRKYKNYYNILDANF